MTTKAKPIEPNADYVKLVVRRLYDAQTLRIQSDLRMQRLLREGIVLKEEAEEKFQKAFELEAAVEKEYETIIWREIKSMPIIQKWAIRVKGIGPRLSGLLVANIMPIERFANPAKLWAYCGLHVIDGKAAHRVKGEKSNWNAELKATAWKIGGCFLRSGGPYREQYDTYKKYLITRELKNDKLIWQSDGTNISIAFPPKDVQVEEWNLKAPDKPEWTLLHIHNMAIRRTVKLFLAHLWAVWREIEGLPTVRPYAVERAGHTTELDPWDFVEPK